MMRMSDGQFEDAMQTVENNIYSNLAQELRDHNAAQREALARVEAERDMAKWNLEQTTRALHHHRERAETAQAQLAEALWHLDGVLNNLPEDLSHRFGGSRSFLARHAQAERTAVTEYIGPHGQELLEHIKAEQKEAQGAQAVDEREAFEKWAKDRSWFDPRPSTKERDDSLFCYEEAITDHNWIAWQARAALANQPAVPEQYEYWSNALGCWRPAQESVEFLTSRGFKVRAVRGAEHE